uniref:Uncharacterized protein n=1 Tax=Ixodes ricinus TaxID=34613 RepID=A0A6B0USR5_IXORI
MIHKVRMSRDVYTRMLTVSILWMLRAFSSILMSMGALAQHTLARKETIVPANITPTFSMLTAMFEFFFFLRGGGRKFFYVSQRMFRVLQACVVEGRPSSTGSLAGLGLARLVLCGCTETPASSFRRNWSDNDAERQDQ